MYNAFVHLTALRDVHDTHMQCAVIASYAAEV